MKKHLLIILLSASFITYASIQAVSDNSGKNGFVGSPGESTCATSGCHNDNAVNSGPGGIILTCTNMSNWQYTPGQTYHFSVSISESGKSLFGFGFEALDSANNSIGTIVVTKSTQMSLHNTSYLGGNNPAGRINIGHVKNGGSSNNSKSFTFDWIAPNNYCGNIHFYTVGAATNKDGLASGDNIYTTNETATPAATGIINHSSKLWPFSSYVGQHSLSQPIYVSGEYLSDSITVYAPTGYEVSLASANGFGDSLKLGPTTKSLRLSPVYVRLNADTVGTFSGNIIITGGGAANDTIAVTGLSYSQGASMLSYTGTVVPFGIGVGNNSASQTITVSGNNLSADATISISSPFKVCTSQGGTYATSITLSPTNGNLTATPIYIKYYPTASGSQNSDLIISSAGATTQTLFLSGTSSANNAAALYVQTDFNPFFTNTVNTPSAPQSFQVDATALSTDVVMAAPTHFEISTQANSGYSKVLTISPSSNTISAQMVYLRYNPKFEATEYETFNIANSSVVSKFISVVGYVAKAQGTIKVTVTGIDSICNGGSVTMEASGAASYNWQPSNQPTSIVTLSPTLTTTYTVTGTTGSQTSKAQFTVNVISPATAGFTSQANDSSVSFTNASTNATCYSWDFGDGQTSTLANPQHIYSAAGTYKVFIKARGLCGTDTISQTVTVILEPTNVFITGNNSICKGDSSTLTAAGASSYVWQPGNVTTNSITVSPLLTTKYTVVGTSGSQTGNAQFTLTVLPSTKAAFSNITNDSLVSLTNNCNNATSYTWDFGDGQTSTLPSPQHIYSKAGTYKIMINAKGVCGTDTTSQFVIVHIDTTTHTTTGGTHNSGINTASANKYALYPNPANKNLYINIDGKATVRLFSIDGKLVQIANITNAASTTPYNLLLPDLKSGMYIVNIVDDSGESYQSKFMIDN